MINIGLLKSKFNSLKSITDALTTIGVTRRCGRCYFNIKTRIAQVQFSYPDNGDDFDQISVSLYKFNKILIGEDVSKSLKIILGDRLEIWPDDKSCIYLDKIAEVHIPLLAMPEAKQKLDTRHLSEKIASLCGIIAEESPRNYGSVLNFSNGRIVATDGYKLSYANYDTAQIDNVNLSKPLAVFLVNFAKGESFLNVYQDDTDIYFEDEYRDICIFRKSNVSYPKIDAILPKTSGKSIAVPKKEILDIAKKSLRFTGKDKYVDLDIRDKTLTINTRDSSYSLELKDLHPEFKMGINCLFFKQILESIKDKTLVLELRGCSDPLLIHSEITKSIIVPVTRE